MLKEKLNQGNALIGNIESLGKTISTLKTQQELIGPTIADAIYRISKFDKPFMETIIDQCICKLEERKAKLEFDFKTL